MIINDALIKKKHDAAMGISELALEMKNIGNYKKFIELSYDAFLLEEECANYAYSNKIGQPTQSVLIRSAATIAIDCKLYANAINLVHMGIEGSPPNEIKQELFDILYKAINKLPN